MLENRGSINAKNGFTFMGGMSSWVLRTLTLWCWDSRSVEPLVTEYAPSPPPDTTTSMITAVTTGLTVSIDDDNGSEEDNGDDMDPICFARKRAEW